MGVYIIMFFATKAARLYTFTYRGHGRLACYAICMSQRNPTTNKIACGEMAGYEEAQDLPSGVDKGGDNPGAAMRHQVEGRAQYYLLDGYRCGPTLHFGKPVTTMS